MRMLIRILIKVSLHCSIVGLHGSSMSLHSSRYRPEIIFYDKRQEKAGKVQEGDYKDGK
jgi:hypothetical protein